MSVAAITPYWRNPRRIPAQAVEAVAESIERYGYVQPIVVDSAGVVIVGHTRLQALKQMKVAEVQVYVTDMDEAKAREYRIVDNKTSEMTTWDHAALVLELREFEQGLLDRFFPEVDLEIEMVASAGAVTENEIAWQTDKVGSITEAADTPTTEVVCPSCFHTFMVRTSALPRMAG